MTREADAMAVATKAWYERITPQPTVHGKLEEFARALTEYGNERAREARAAAIGLLAEIRALADTPPLGVAEHARSDGRYADLLRRRADVYSAAREPSPYYGDDDIDLLRSMLNEARAEIAQLEKQLADIVSEKKAEIRRLRDAIVSARWRLAKGRAIWNGPSIECDAALERGLTGADIRERASKLELAALDAPAEAEG